MIPASDEQGSHRLRQYTVPSAPPHSTASDRSTLLECEDVASTICVYLLVQCRLGCSHIADCIGLPTSTVKQCIRKGISSPFFRLQLSQWLQEEGKSIADRLPCQLVRTLFEKCATDELSLGRGKSEECWSGVLGAMDLTSEAHFADLSSSVGQRFSSILNDAEVAAEGNTWTQWLGAKVYDALENSSAGAMKATESSSALLAEHVIQDDFSAYVSMISSAFSENRREGRPASHRELVEMRCEGNELPWPERVPAEFFLRDYSTVGEVEGLPLHTAAPSSLMSYEHPGSVSASGDLSSSSQVDHLPKVVDKLTPLPRHEGVIPADAFAKDFAVLESRMKVLRAYEAEVEQCLLRHVSSRSEDFFRVSHRFVRLGAEASEALNGARQARGGSIAYGKQVVHAYTHIGVLYRRRNNFVALQGVLQHLQRILRQLTDIENWVALPERDMTELPSFVRMLVELDHFLSSPGPGAPADRLEREEGERQQSGLWSCLSGLRYMQDIRARASDVRRLMETLISLEMTSILSSDLQNSELWERGTHACEAAALAGVWEDALRGYQKACGPAQWSRVREAVAEFLLGNAVLTDVVANELISLAQVDIPSANERKAFFTYCTSCPYSLFLQLCMNLTDVLVSDVTRVLQNWGYFLVECASKVRLLHTSDSDSIRKATVALTVNILHSAESTLALLVEVYGQEKRLTNTEEVERITRLCLDHFVSQLLAPVETLVSLLPGKLTGMLQQFHVGRTLSHVCKVLCKRFFRWQHERNVEKLQIVLESESWAPKEAVHPVFQSHLEHLCGTGERAVLAFDGLCAERVRSSVDNVMPQTRDPAAVGGNCGASRIRSPELDVEDDEVLNAKVNRLYLSLEGEDEGRVASNSILITIELLYDYEQCLARFPSLAIDVMARMHDILCIYDTQCAALVLGAMSVKNGALSSITSQHLCVASQSVAFLHELIPRLQAHLVCVLRVKPTVDGRDMPRRQEGKLWPFIHNEFGRVAADCAAHRDDFFRKVTLLVEEKVDSLGAEPASQWSPSGNEWVMTMLREAARLLRTLRPLLPPSDVQVVMVPLLGSLALKLRKVSQALPSSDRASRDAAASDILLFKANVEKFGFDVLHCAETVRMARTHIPAAALKPSSSDGNVLAWFFPS